MEEGGGKRRRSEEGLFSLLGTYASDEDDVDAPEELLRRRSGEILSAKRARSEEPAVDLEAAVASAGERLGSQQLRDTPSDVVAAAPATVAETEPTPAQTHATDSTAAERYWLPEELAEPPDEACDSEIQARVTDYLSKQEASGTTIVNKLRSLPGYRNPDFLQHCVLYDSISEYGSCYPADIFDPNNLPPEDYYDRLAAEWQLHMEQQRAERSKTQKIDFAKKGTETLNRAGGLNSASVAANLVAQAKAMTAGHRSSKWDSKR